MDETGIVRRMDELGRVVIPKELRKVMRLKEGVSLEISADKEKLTIRKYSPIYSIGSNAESVALSIDEIMGKPCIITDTDKVICVSRTKYREMLNKNISKGMDKILSGRKSVVLNRVDGGTVIPISDTQENIFENEIIVPVMNNGDCFGAIIVFNTDSSERFDANDVKFVTLGASILSRQFD